MTLCALTKRELNFFAIAMVTKEGDVSLGSTDQDITSLTFSFEKNMGFKRESFKQCAKHKIDIVRGWH